MPLYEYRCEECGAQFEKLVGASNRDDVECAECGAERTQRQVSTFAARSTGASVASSAPTRFT